MYIKIYIPVYNDINIFFRLKDVLFVTPKCIVIKEVF